MSRSRPLWGGLYGVFADGPGGGSIAGVVVCPAELPSDRMQAIAKDLLAPTTGFVVTGARAAATLPIRFFSPRQEMDACGYATVAAATALRESGHWQPRGKHALRAGGGLYELHYLDHGVRLDVSVAGHQPLDVSSRSLLADALGVPLAEGRVEVVDTGLRHLVLPVQSRAALSGFRPDRAVAERIAARHRVDTIALVAGVLPGVEGVDLRDVCAPVGDLEEPASGTTAAAVADFYRRHFGGTSLTVRQGEDMGRPSVIRTHARVDGVVEVSGTARPVLTGALT